jgi:hypothetical protein
MADLTNSVQVGFSDAFQAFVVSATSVASLNHFHKGFRNNLGVSGKVACVVMPTFFMFAFSMQQDVVRQNKANWRKQVLANTKQDNSFRFATPPQKID